MAYTFCPDEGWYDIQVSANVAGGGVDCEFPQWEYSDWYEDVYDVNYDGLQAWCECHGDYWISSVDMCCGGTDYWCGTGYESCMAGVYYNDGDDNLETCECGGGSWNIGGEPDGPCCGNIATENVLTCLDNDEGICDISSNYGAEPENNDACCQAGDKCVYKNNCYDNGADNPEYSEYGCQAGTWHDDTPPLASITINNGDGSTAMEDVTLSLTFSDGGSGTPLCRWMNDGESWTGWQICGASPQDRLWTLRDEDGTRIVYFQVDDGTGNVGEVNDDIILDRQPPSAWIDAPPEWTNSTDGSGNVYFQVTWDGNDAASGIASYDIQYRILDRVSGTYVNNNCGGSGWCDWIARTEAQPKSEFFGIFNSPEDVENFNNRTFLFRASATDNAGNTQPYDAAGPYSNTSIDVVAPVCTVEDLPDYQGTSNFNVIFNSVEGESGMARFEALIRGPDGTGGWIDPLDPETLVCLNLTPMDDADTVTLDCVLNRGEWEFGCRGTDHSGNTGLWSTVENTTVDMSAPVVLITEPDSEWWYLDVLTLSWYDTASDVDHYDIYYYNTTWPGSLPADPPWQHWNTYPSSVTTATFGGGDPVLSEGQTYYINVTSTDYAGNQDSDYVNVTIEMTPPVIHISITDQGGTPIQPGWIPSGLGVELINITSNAYDELSGILGNTIEYLVYGEVPEHKWLECGEGPSPGYSICSTAGSNPNGWEDIGYDETKSVRYRINATDRAGNMNITRYYFTVSHPLANFVSAGCHIYLGDTRLVPVMVRNVQNQVDNITLNLTGYPFADFEYNCDPSDCIISTETRGMVALNVNPYEERRYYVRVISSEPGEEFLVLNASSSIDPTLNDSHIISIRTSYPTYFPGLESWAIVLLLVIAGFAYGTLSRDKP